ncbi:MAG TPA: hypothetical protein VFW73_01130 [Lacipirellulaceae bacterium]|nr:hypothetical protein [Lacipirellulaceae bacterium]
MQKTLDEKLARIVANPSCNDFILADAKDADMAYGISAPGLKNKDAPEHQRYRSIQEFRDLIRQVVEQQLVDIMLMSASTSDLLAVRERIFDKSPVTPAIRANDTTDIWLAGGQASYGLHPSLPFRTAILDEVMDVGDAPVFGLNRTAVDLGLYSITFNNDAVLDRVSLEAYRAFRDEARGKDFRYFLEVFVPNAPARPVEDVPRYVNDCITRTLAGVGSSSRPLFLKIPYFGPAALEQLVSYDSSLVVGILGGSAGTTFDAFQMLWEAKKYGARAALFGRKINSAEHQLSFIEQLRALADGTIEPADAVKAYHAALEERRISPHRTLAEDLESTNHQTTPAIIRERSGRQPLSSR